MTLRRRVLIAILALAVVVLALGGVATFTTARYLQQRIDNTLRAGPLTSLPNAALLTQAPRNICTLTEIISDAVVILADRQGVPISPCPGRPQLKIDVSAIRFLESGVSDPITVTDVAGERYRVMVRRFPNALIVFGYSLRSTEVTIRRVGLVQLAATLLSVGVSALVASWLLRRGVRPLDEIAMTADRIASGDRTLRVGLAGTPNDETGRVGVAFNAMLDELDRNMGQVEHSEQRLRRFIQDASHELRTPITSIRGYAELYHAGMLPDEPSVANAMGRIQSESIRMSNLVQDMLQLATFDVEPKLQLVSTNLVSLVQAMVTDAKAAHPQWPVTMQSSRKVMQLNVDTHAMQQVIANLLGNIRSHTPAGTATTIELAGAHDNSDALTITVRDNGPGIDPNILGEVFERFVQASPSRSRGAAKSGAGLGLSIVRSIISAHGGTIAASNHPEGGALFEISLPNR
jgi:two-component system, OmpR family, sensor kinase